MFRIIIRINKQEIEKILQGNCMKFELIFQKACSHTIARSCREGRSDYAGKCPIGDTDRGDCVGHIQNIIRRKIR